MVGPTSSRVFKFADNTKMFHEVTSEVDRKSEKAAERFLGLG